MTEQDIKNQLEQLLQEGTCVIMGYEGILYRDVTNSSGKNTLGDFYVMDKNGSRYYFTDKAVTEALLKAGFKATPHEGIPIKYNLIISPKTE